jgi:hypothetical protein
MKSVLTFSSTQKEEGVKIEIRGKGNHELLCS